MRRLVFVTQQVDPGHPALAATVAMLRALAERVDEVAVLADGAVPGTLPANCRVHTFGAATRAGRGARFEAALARELRPRPLAVVAHMCPIYAVLAAPLVRPLRIRFLLWYTHWQVSRTLRAAERVVTDVVSVDRRSFPLPSGKVTAIGHGIDMSEFRCVEPAPDGPLRVLALGRYSEAKGLETILRAAALVAGARLDAYGPALNPREEAHRRELDRLVGELQLGHRVRLLDPVPRTEVPALFARSDVLVNNMRAGATDKVVFEACASCLPVLASNPAFDELLEPPLRFDREDPVELAGRLEAFRQLDAGERAALGRMLRARVVERHSVESWADGILRVASA